MSQGGGEKVRLRISACDKQGNTYQAIGSPPPFNAMLNPSAIKRSLAIDYDVKEVPGLSAQTPKFQSTQSGGLSFELLLDGTGAVPDSSDQTVTQRVEALGKLVYQYAGQKHEPNVVQVLWGDFLFYGRLKSMNLDYQLFKPSGEPLRVRVSLDFIGTMTSAEEARMAGRSSPDLSHVVEVRAGDSLPLLCQRVYGDAAYYVDVARHNRIVNFRAIRPGQKILFPPLR